MPRAAPAGRDGGGARRAAVSRPSARGSRAAASGDAGCLEGAGIPRRRERPRSHEGGAATVRAGTRLLPRWAGAGAVPEAGATPSEKAP